MLFLKQFEKKDSGVRPIAVGCILRCSVSKIAENRVMSDMASLPAPQHLEFGVQGDAEAAIYATRLYIRYLQPNHMLPKASFKENF